jgi:membrane protein DedA with SNARE-associated domain
MFAGTDRLPWRRFFLANAARGIVWATAVGTVSWLLGAAVQGPLTYVGYALDLVVTAAAYLTFHSPL